MLWIKLWTSSIDCDLTKGKLISWNRKMPFTPLSSGRGASDTTAGRAASATQQIPASPCDCWSMWQAPASLTPHFMPRKPTLLMTTYNDAPERSDTNCGWNTTVDPWDLFPSPTALVDFLIMGYSKGVKPNTSFNGVKWNSTHKIRLFWEEKTTKPLSLRSTTIVENVGN